MGTGAEVALIALAATSVAASAAGAGLSFYGQQQQAAAAERMGRYNAAVQEQQFLMQAAMASAQADAQRRAGMINAAEMENQALRVEQEARERARRMREENERMLGAQRARFGKAGVTSAGSPLAVMAESAGLMELGVGDELYKADMERSAFYRKADMERWQANMSLLDSSAAQYNMNTARTRALPLLLQGRNDAAAARVGSYGSLISGVGNVASTGMQYGMWKAG